MLYGGVLGHEWEWTIGVEDYGTAGRARTRRISASRSGQSCSGMISCIRDGFSTRLDPEQHGVALVDWEDEIEDRVGQGVAL